VGVQQLTPASECNRPGLGAINYRVGTHGQFLTTMKARLSTMVVDGVASDGQTVQNFRPLQGLTTRDANDFSIALLDGWATVGDVLSFYQERIANEGYLRTSTERRSVLELSRLIGYSLRPGVAASVYLAYTIDDKQLDPVTIPAGARSQSLPGPGETPQSFETSDPLDARAAWNSFQPRMSRPQTKESILGSSGKRLYFKGINTNLKVNDALLIDLGDGTTPTLYRVQQVQPDAASDRTLVAISDWSQSALSSQALVATRANADAAVAGPTVGPRTGVADPAIGIISRLTLPPSLPPRGALNLPRSLGNTFTKGADIAPQIISAIQPVLQGTFAAALANEPATATNPIRVYALRAKAGLFGSNLPGQPNYSKDSTTGMISISSYTYLSINDTFGKLNATLKPLTIVALDADYEKIKATGWVAIDRPPLDPTSVNVGATTAAAANSVRTVTVHSVMDVKTTTLSASGVSTKSTQLTLRPGWLSDDRAHLRFALSEPSMLHGTSIFAQSEELLLADEPMVDDICDGSSSWIELDGYYNDLKSGRWAIVSGDRADITTPDPNDPSSTAVVPGVHSSELVMLSGVVQDIALSDDTPASQYQPTVGVTPPSPLPGEKLHTFVRFAKNLQYCYRRDKVTIYGNVVKATHGETRNEVLGNGDGSKALQSFTLKQPPLTFVAAPTPVGGDSTLHVYVNDVEWHETESLAWLGPKDHDFVTQTDDNGNTSLTFGDGEHGARLPTGLVNVKAVYRNGIGNVGNVRAEQISLLQTRPLGVKAVINPIRASGGGDKESRDLARENAPLSVMPLDRLVSVRDYADFTRRFAGVAKALAQRTSDGRIQLLYLTIAGIDDAPIDVTSDLYRNLLEALRDFGDPDLPLRVDLRELLVLVLSANIKLAPDYLWEPVVTAVRAQLLAAFGFGKRGLGQWALISEVISAIQNVAGVAYVDVDAFGAIPEKVPDQAPDGTPIRRLQTPQEVIAAVQAIINPTAIVAARNAIGSRDQLARSVKVWPGGADHGVLIPAGLAIFSPTIPDTLILNQIQ